MKLIRLLSLQKRTATASWLLPHWQAGDEQNCLADWRTRSNVLLNANQRKGLGANAESVAG
jgi:hypothetical protein